MYCRNCGKEIPDGSVTCSHCGTPVSGARPVKPDYRKETAAADTSKTGLALVGFILSLFAFVTGIVFGALFFEFAGSQLLLFILGASTILPALSGLSIGAYLLCSARGISISAKAFSVIAIVLAAIVLLFLFIAGCVLVTES